MAKIRVYNVKHGDFILLGLDNNILVTRDFGSLDGYVNCCIEHHIRKCKHCFPFRFTRCHSRNCFGCYMHNEAILTHPHSDHYSGYELMYNNGIRKIYDRAYVPYLDLKAINSTPTFHSLQLETALCFIVAMPSVKTLKVQEWIKVAPLMSSLSKKIIGVYQGCNAFSHWQPQGTVLWPPLPSDDYYKRREKKLNDMLGIFSNNVIGYVEPIYKELSTILTSIFDKDNDFHGYEGLKQNDNDFQIAEEYESNDALSKVRRLLEGIAGRFVENNNESIEKMYLSFGNLIDDHSIAFSIGAKDNAALFLSDFHDSAMNRMVNFMTYSDFKLIKSAHHGTRLGKRLEAFLSSQPLADEVIHCCGPSKNSNYHGPSPRYDKLAKDTYCTDWNNSSTKWGKRNSKYQLFKNIYEDFVL